MVASCKKCGEVLEFWAQDWSDVCQDCVDKMAAEIERLRAELVSSNAHLHNLVVEAREAARALWFKMTFIGKPKEHIEKTMSYEQIKQQWPWLEEE